MRTAILLVGVLAACSTSHPKSTPLPVSPPAAIASPAPDEPARGDMTGARPRRMVNCPSAVAGARTAMVETEAGADLLISATTTVARDEIRRLGHVHAGIAAPTSLGLHTGRHTGTGRIGYCPIIHTGGTVVTVDDTSSGVRIHMRAAGPASITRLRAEVARRVAGIQRVAG